MKNRLEGTSYMKFTVRKGAAGVAMIAALGFAAAANAAPVTASAEAKAEIVKALVIVKDTDLDFGKIAVTGVAGQVVVAPDNSVTSCSASLTCYAATSAAKFDVTEGSPNKSLSVKLPAETLLVRIGAVSTGTDASGAALYDPNDTLELTDYTTNATATDVFDATSGALLRTDYSVTLADPDGDLNGEATFSIGGTLSLDGTEPEGQYETTIFVDVDYI